MCVQENLLKPSYDDYNERLLNVTLLSLRPPFVMTTTQIQKWNPKKCPKSRRNCLDLSSPLTP